MRVRVSEYLERHGIENKKKNRKKDAAGYDRTRRCEYSSSSYKSQLESTNIGNNHGNSSQYEAQRVTRSTSYRCCVCVCVCSSH